MFLLPSISYKLNELEIQSDWGFTFWQEHFISGVLYSHQGTPDYSVEMLAATDNHCLDPLFKGFARWWDSNSTNLPPFITWDISIQRNSLSSIIWVLRDMLWKNSLPTREKRRTQAHWLCSMVRLFIRAPVWVGRVGWPADMRCEHLPSWALTISAWVIMSQLTAEPLVPTSSLSLTCVLSHSVLNFVPTP